MPIRTTSPSLVPGLMGGYCDRRRKSRHTGFHGCSGPARHIENTYRPKGLRQVQIPIRRSACRALGRFPAGDPMNLPGSVRICADNHLVAAGIFSLGYFSFGFLLLRAHDVGFSIKETVLLYALFNASFVVAAPLVGRLGDNLGRTRIVLLSYVSYLLMCLGFAVATVKWQVIALFVLYGIFFSIDEAQSRAFIADVEPERRATAIGAYNFVTGGIYLLASMMAGALWAVGPKVVFALAASVSAIAAAMFAWLRPAER